MLLPLPRPAHCCHSHLPHREAALRCFRSPWELLCVRGVREAKAVATRLPVAVVISEEALPSCIR